MAAVPARNRDDCFARWREDREEEALSSPSAQYVAPGIIGYSTLDGYGNWEPMAVYGSGWFPRVNAGWAPYRDGHWAWIEPGGWTWVDDEPWGFAPFHYGRWAFAEFTDVFRMQDDFAKKVEAEFARMIDAVAGK